MFLKSKEDAFAIKNPVLLAGWVPAFSTDWGVFAHIPVSHVRCSDMIFNLRPTPFCEERTVVWCCVAVSIILTGAYTEGLYGALRLFVWRGRTPCKCENAQFLLEQACA